MTNKELEKINANAVTPQFDLYEDDMQAAKPIKNIDDANPKDLDKYVGAEVTLPIGGQCGWAK